MDYHRDTGTLASSPLTKLPLVEKRLQERGAPDNALYFPYVAGLRPYSRGQDRDLVPDEQQALVGMYSVVI